MKLTESEIFYIINEARALLTEDQESDSIRKAIALYMDVMGCSKQEADKFVRIDLRDDFPNLRSKRGGKFILGVTRMFLNRQITNNIKQLLDATIPFVASEAHYQEYDKNLNGLSANEIIDRFEEERKQAAAADREKLSQQEYQKNTQYEIIPVSTLEETSQYAQFCYPMDRWCITRSQDMLDRYTNDGIGQFYFCLKKGFEDMEPIQGENCPLDEYGLSMIAVCVNGEGDLKTCTCRWNHSNGGNDNVMNTEQISKVLGVNFYDVFKPNNNWANAVRDVAQRLKNGENINDLFSHVYQTNNDDIYRVVFKHMYNYVRMSTKDIISDVWFKGGSSRCKCGFIGVVVDNNKKALLNIEDGKVYNNNTVYKKISLTIEEFLNKGHNVEELKDYGFIDYSMKVWTVDNMYEVRCLKKYNLINGDKKFLFDEWYDDISVCLYKKDTYYKIKKDNECVLLNSKLENVLGRTYKYISNVIMPDGTISIIDDEGGNVISVDNPEQKLCKQSSKGYMSIIVNNKETGKKCFAVQRSDELYDLVDDNGDIRINEGFRSFRSYVNEYIIGQKNNKYVIIYTDNFEVSDWYDRIEGGYYISRTSPYITVYKENKVGLVNCYEHRELPYWFDNIITLAYGWHIVIENGLYNLLTNNEDIYFDEWVKEIKQTRSYGSDLYVTDNNGKKNIFSIYSAREGNPPFYLKHWYDDVVYDYVNDKVIITDDGEQIECNIYELSLHNL